MTEPITPDLDAAIGFLEAFAPDGPVNLCAMNANTGRVEGATFNDLGAARTWLERRSGSMNVYYTVNPSPNPTGDAGRVRKVDIPEGHHTHVDIDCDKAVDDLTLEQRKAAMLERLEASEHPPTFVTDSGGGLQPVWKLDAPVTVEQVEGINRWLIEKYGGDPGTWNADRLLRLPGTINHLSAAKIARGRVVAPTKLVRSTRELHGVETFGRIDAPSKAEADIVLGAPEEVDIETLGLPERLLTIIRDGEIPGDVKPGDNSASGWLFDGVVNLLRHGAMPEQVLWIILDPDLGISTSVLKRPDDDQLRYAEHQVRSALATIEGERLADVKSMGDLDSRWLEDNKDDLPEPKKLGDDEERIGRLTLVHADRVEMKPLTPLWPGRIYIGKLTTLAGVPDQGKSMVTCDIAARVSRGLAWPDGSGFAPKGTAIFLAAEDDKADTIVPRLAAAGADLTKVKILNSLVISHKDRRQQRTFNIAEDIAELTTLVRRYPDTRVLFIDPTNAFMGTSKENDSFRDSDVRAVLGPLKEWAEGHGVAVVLITHFKKGGTGRALDQVMGSLAFVALARSSWAFLEEKDVDGEPTGRKLLAKIKQNITAPVDALACHIDGVELSNGLTAPRIVWEDVVEGNADMIMSGGSGGEKMKVAKAFLLGTLAEGPVKASEVLADAERAGISEKTLNRAKKALGVESVQRDGAWHWEVGETEMPAM